MKKIASIIAVLTMALTICFSSSSCGGLTVGATVAQLQSECPLDMGNGLTMTAADLEDGNVVVTISAPGIKSDMFNEEAAKPALLQYLQSEPDVRNLFKETNTAISYKFVLADGEKMVTVTPSEM